MNQLHPIYNLKIKKPRYVIIPRVLTTKECEAIATKIPTQPMIFEDESQRFNGAFIENRSGVAVDDKMLNEIDCPDTFPKIYNAFVKANVDLNVQLTGFIDHLRLQHYRRGQYLDWHTDMHYNCFKLSGIILLTNKFTGGRFELLSNFTFDNTFPIGDMLVFPSFMAHRIMKVKSGDRATLTCLTMGEEYR